MFATQGNLPFISVKSLSLFYSVEQVRLVKLSTKKKCLSDKMSSSTSPSVLLNTGVQMPLLGLGTYKLLTPENVYQAVDAALAAGYRAFDSAAVYHNEAHLGRALKELLPKHGLNRGDVFITR